MSLPRSQRLRDANAWKLVRRRGRRDVGAHAVVHALRSEEACALGFSNTKGFRRAVDRNRARRRVRAAFLEVYQPPVERKSTWWVTVAAKPEALHATFDELKQSLRGQLTALGLAANCSLGQG